ncbi:MAG TPA: DUF222 domain-containing protein [Kofleriaceae bacterium]|nr:DUF222 domain-containing protein [Kofleriaceae bacterium]
MQTSAKVELEALGDQIAEMAAHIDAAMHRLLTAIREFDQANGWYAQGALSCAHWLTWRIGWDLRTSRERLRVARKLADLPAIDEELRTGAMSYSQARAISRVATGKNEKLWVEYAKRMPASGLDKLCRAFQSVQGYADGASTTTAAPLRSVTRRTLDHGMVKLELVLTNDEAAIVWAAINAVRDQKSEPRTAQTPAEPSVASAGATFIPPPTESPEARSTRRADAFMTIFHDRVRGDRPQRTPVEIIITVPHGSLHGSAEPSDLATFADGDVMAASTAQRLCCDAGVVIATIDDKGQPLSIGRKTRTIPPAIKRALLVRDQTCRFPGCHHRSYVDGHHVAHWTNGGRTALSNLMLLCTAHHRLLHEGNFRVESDGADGWHFYDERNRRVVPQPARVTLQTAAPQRAHGIDRLRNDNADLAISADTHATMWTGEDIDYGTCIDYLV